MKFEIDLNELPEETLNFIDDIATKKNCSIGEVIDMLITLIREEYSNEDLIREMFTDPVLTEFMINRLRFS